jgi:U32 family peptidase
MFFTTFISSTDDLERCQAAPEIGEVLIEPARLAQQGKLTAAEAESLAIQTQRAGLRPVLVWDILMTDQIIQQIVEELAEWNLNHYAGIRVQDFGAAEWLTKNRPQNKLQLILQGRSHNHKSLQILTRQFAANLERFILSNELTAQNLITYIKELPVGCEILGAGPLLLHYTPRKLLSKYQPHSAAQPLKALSRSKDLDSGPLPTLETEHGRFLFLDKDLFILDRIEPLAAAGLQAVGIDLRQLSTHGHSAEGIGKICEACRTGAPQAEKIWPTPVCAPFFADDDASASCPELKPKLYALKDKDCVAEVLSIENHNHLALLVLQEFNPQDRHFWRLTTGQQIECQDLSIQDYRWRPLSLCQEGAIVLTPRTGGVTPSALLLRSRSDTAA